MPRVRVNDVDLYHETTGQGQLVLLVHGLSSSARDGEPQTAAFLHAIGSLPSMSTAAANRNNNGEI